MDGNKWQELNSSTTRIGQSSQVRPPQQSAGAAPGTTGPNQTGSDGGSDEQRAAGGLPVAAKAGLALGAAALLAIGGFVVFAGGDDAESPDALALADGSSGDTSTDAAEVTDTTVAADAPATTTAADDDADEDPSADESGDDAMQDGTATDETSGDETAAGETAGDESSDDESSDDESGDDGSDAAAEDVSPIGADSPPSPPGAPVTHSILANGKIYLRGTVPSEAIEGLIVAAVSEVLGEGNVVSEYVVDPSIPFDPNRSAPVYIADTVLFAPGSAEIAPDFYPLLGLGVSLIQIQPTVSIEIVGHTDAQGSDQDNLVLSQQRVDAVRAWMVAQGADGERLVAIGKGETEPRADNSTPEGRQSNRRVEFIISGFEFG